MWVALGATFRDISWSGARAVVLTGAGGDFCAGADLGRRRRWRRRRGRRRGNQLDAMRVLGDVVLAVHECPVPVIAKVDGVAVGAGFGLALAADMTWCSDRARFSAIFAKRGLSLDFGTSWLLRQRVGVHVAKQLAFTAEMVSGERALELGLVNAVTPVAELDDAVAAIAATIAAGPPIALSMTKRELDHAGSGSLAQALEAEALAQNVNTRTDDMAEAMTAYMERRPPNFQGSGADTAMTREWALGDVHDVVSATVPERTMIVHGERRCTYGEVNERSRGARRVPGRAAASARSATAASWRAGKPVRIASPSSPTTRPSTSSRCSAAGRRGSCRATSTTTTPRARSRSSCSGSAPGRDLRPPSGREARRRRPAARPADRDRRRVPVAEPRRRR